MSAAAWLWIAAAASLGAFFALGMALSRAPALWRIDVEAAALRGRGAPVAALFTLSGRALPLTLFGIVLLGVVYLRHGNAAAGVAIVAVQLLSQASVEVCKRALARNRPDEWLLHHELGYSYPSGHATTAIVFYGSWLAFALLTPMPPAAKLLVCGALLLWMLGIDWSRMALGAHYPTDVAGGTLFGLAWACALWAALLTAGAVAS